MKIVLTGFHAIEEAVKKAPAALPQDRFLLYYREPAGPRCKKILGSANAKHLSVIQTSNTQLNDLVKDLPQPLQEHRGIVLVEQRSQEIISLESFLAARMNTKVLTVAMLSNIIDPHNVGAILRSADQFSVDAVIVSEHKSAGDYGIIAKISSGANNFVPLIAVKNLNRAVEQLRSADFWFYGAELNGQPLGTVDFAPHTCIVLGSEGHGIAESLKAKMDVLVTIETAGHVDSLNVSNAAAVIFYKRFFNNQNK